MTRFRLKLTEIERTGKGNRSTLVGTIYTLCSTCSITLMFIRYILRIYKKADRSTLAGTVYIYKCLYKNL